jgi:type IV secretory pathway VirB4 component
MKFQFYKQFHNDGTIELEDGSFMTTIQVFGIEFMLLDEETQNEQIRILANFFQLQTNKVTFFKTDLPFNFEKQKSFLKKLNNNEQQEVYLQQLLSIEKEKLTESCYFFFVYGYSKEELESNVNNSLAILNKGKFKAIKTQSETVKILLSKLFSSKYSNDNFFMPIYLNFKKENFHTEKY